MSDSVVWLVTEGSYSDYSVTCACRSEADAQKLADRLNDDGDTWDEYRVESVSLVAPDIEKVSVLHLSQEVWDDGTTSELREVTSDEWPIYKGWSTGATTSVCSRWVRAPCHHGKGGRLHVQGMDHERVRKVHSEKVARLLADDAMRSRREIES